MITGDQLLCHLIGDYLLQSDWMALNKSKQTIPCLIHCVTYTVCFLFLTRSPVAILFVFATHFAIDRFGLARFLVWAKNWQSPAGYRPWSECSLTGYSSDRPDWLTVWLYIVVDNTLHLACNGLALTFM